MHARNECYRSDCGPELDRLCRVRGIRGLVVSSPTMCHLRPHRMLRRFARPPCHRARDCLGARGHPLLRAWRELVLQLRDFGDLRGPGARSPRESSRRSVHSRPGGAGAPGLAGKAVGAALADRYEAPRGSAGAAAGHGPVALPKEVDSSRRAGRVGRPRSIPPGSRARFGSHSKAYPGCALVGSASWPTHRQSSRPAPSA